MGHQQHVVDVALEIDPLTGLLVYREVVLVMMRQNGKALDVDTPVLTARGWTTMGAIVPGDRVFHPAGHLVQVAAVSEVMLGRDCLRVTGSDGRSVIADADHLWTVRDTANQPRTPWRTLTTRQLAAAGLARGRQHRFQLPHQGALKTPDVDLPLDPYLLGVWLGDGTARRAEVTSADPEIFEAFAAAGFAPSYAYKRGRAVTRGLRGLVKVLRVAGLLGNKHVPEPYLTAGTDQRLELLRGLLDTDGAISVAGQVEFSSTSSCLAHAVMFLARSLGWRPIIREGRSTLRGVDHGPKWRVTFTPDVGEPNPFRLARKAERVRKLFGKRRPVAIATVEAVPTRPVRCIEVDSPDGLYLAGGGLMATHNSELILPVITHRSLTWAEQMSVYTTNTAGQARKRWEDVHMKRLQKSPFASLFGVRLQIGQEALLFANGSAYSPISTTAKTGGTGDTIDLGVIDEAWVHEDSRVEQALRPAMLTRPQPQMWITSMVPGPTRAESIDSKYLFKKMDVGRARVEAGLTADTCYFEYGAATGMDPGDPATWRSCMPALGQTISEEAIRADFAAMELLDFTTEYLSWRLDDTDSGWAEIPRGDWELARDAASAPVGAITLAVDVLPDRSEAAICASGFRVDTLIHVELTGDEEQGADYRAGVGWVIPRLVQIVANLGMNRPVVIVINDRILGEAATEAGLTVHIPQARDVAAWCGTFFDEVAGPFQPARRLKHRDQADMDNAVRTAEKRPVGGAWAWAQNCVLTAASLAVGALLTPRVHTPVQETFAAWR